MFTNPDFTKSVIADRAAVLRIGVHTARLRRVLRRRRRTST